MSALFQLSEEQTKALVEAKGGQGVMSNILNLPLSQNRSEMFLFHGLNALGKTKNVGEFFDTWQKDRI